MSLTISYKDSPILSALLGGTVTLTTAGKYLEGNIAVTTTPGLEYETGIFTPSANIARATVSFSNSHSTVPFFVAMSDISGAFSIPNNTQLEWCYLDAYKAFGAGYPYDASNLRYGIVTYVYKSNSNPTTATTQLVYNSDNTSTTDGTYARYWVTESNFYPYTRSSSRYWRANRNYKWIAVWI